MVFGWKGAVSGRRIFQGEVYLFEEHWDSPLRWKLEPSGRAKVPSQVKKVSFRIE